MVYEFSALPRGECGLIHPLNSDRVSIERREGLRKQVNISKIDRLPQKHDLVVAFGFIDMPGLWAPLITRTP